MPNERPDSAVRRWIRYTGAGKGRQLSELLAFHSARSG